MGMPSFERTPFIALSLTVNNALLWIDILLILLHNVKHGTSGKVN